jgi:hypothetical protein
MPVKKLPKFIVSNLMLILALAVHLPAIGAAPAILNVTTTGYPGDIVSIQGENFGDHPGIIYRRGRQKTRLKLVNCG